MSARPTVLLALVACSAGTARPPVAPDAPPIVEVLAPPVTYRPSAPEAVRYNDPSAAALPDSPRASAVFAGLVDAARGRGVLARDPRLDVASRELAALLPAGVTLGPAAVELALHARGVVEPAARVVIGHGATPAQIAEDLAAQLGASLFASNVQVGLAVAEAPADPTVAIVTYAPAVTLAPTPRFVRTGEAIDITATLGRGLAHPRVAITAADGAIAHPPVTVTEAGAFAFRFACGGRPGDRWIEVEAGEDPAPLVLVPIACGEPPRAAVRLEPAANLPARGAPRGEVERRLVALINRERLAAGRAALPVHPRAAAAALGYAGTMRAAGSIAHDLGGATADARLRAVGLAPPLLLETTLHVEQLDRAAELLLNDPRYRADVLDARVTQCGLGAVETADHQWYIAILLAQVPPLVDAGHLVDETIARLRAGYDQPRRWVDPRLAAIARAYAAGLARGRSEAEMSEAVQYDLDRIGSHYAKIHKTVVTLVDAGGDKLDRTALLAGHVDDRIGVGVAQSEREGPLGGRIFVVVYFGEVGG